LFKDFVVPVPFTVLNHLCWGLCYIICGYITVVKVMSLCYDNHVQQSVSWNIYLSFAIDIFYLPLMATTPLENEESCAVYSVISLLCILHPKTSHSQSILCYTVHMQCLSRELIVLHRLTLVVFNCINPVTFGDSKLTILRLELKEYCLYCLAMWFL